MPIKVLDNTFIFHRVGGEEVAFEISNEDTTDSILQYYGYISSFGSWIIQRFEIIGTAILYRYVAGKTRTDYDAFWDNNGVYIGGAIFVTFDQIKVAL